MERSLGTSKEGNSNALTLQKSVLHVVKDSLHLFGAIILSEKKAREH